MTSDVYNSPLLPVSTIVDRICIENYLFPKIAKGKNKQSGGKNTDTSKPIENHSETEK